jgi:hypothetical protein
MSDGGAFFLYLFFFPKGSRSIAVQRKWGKKRAKKEKPQTSDESPKDDQ